MFDVRLEGIKQNNPGYWAARVLSELEFAHEMSKTVSGEYDGEVDRAVSFLVQANEREGTVTHDDACRAEEILAPLAAKAKSYGAVWAAHAHIDMNWMWRWDETVAVTLDTFRTMLDLMKEYPGFKFSQSQASVYQIVENYAPEMLEEIRQRIREGRWEVIASTWVEADKNMPNGESQVRHLLYTRRYLSQLLGLKPENFQFDFEPDTFGHHANVPEVLASGGVKYYYHCRGDAFQHLYRWVAPSGRSIIVYREPHWYLGYVEPSMLLHAPSFCQRYGLDTILKVYGVGDHGGGPTRRDVERIQDMAQWPVFPSLRFGTFADFFSGVEKVADRLDVVKGELNFIFTGCYTSQSRIKRANRIGEATLNSAETFSALAALKGTPANVEAFAKGWQNILFNQFHDIIPGSGIIDAREYALGLFQQTMALASSQKNRAFHALTAQAGLPAQQGSLAGSIAEGAGVGFGIAEFKNTQVSRGGGKKRLFHLFNSSPLPRRGVVEALVWDWDGDLNRLAFQDEQGKTLRHQVLDRGWNDYWGHRYLRAVVEAEAPACGFGTIAMTETDAKVSSISMPDDWRTEEPDTLVLENELVRAAFDRISLALTSLVDKGSGADLIGAGRPAVFRRIQEDDRLGMTAWTVGRYMTVQNLTEGVRLLKLERKGSLRQSLTYEVAAGPSKLAVTISLDAGSRQLEFAVEADWHEIGRRGEGIPQLNFLLPVAYACQAYRYDIPFNTIERLPAPLDVPGNSWGAALPQDQGQPFVQLITEGNYGFRGDENALALTMLRSSFDPDPHPELGIHRIRFAVAVAQAKASNASLIAAAYDYTHPVEVFSGAGSRPGRMSFLELAGGQAAVAAVKTPADGVQDEWIVRLYETEGQPTQAVLKFDPASAGRIVRASWVDSHEQPLDGKAPIQVDGQQIKIALAPYQLGAVRLKFAPVV